MSARDRDVRLGVVLKLQKRRDRNSPGTAGFETADHAIDLALSEGRAAESQPFLYRNVWRDSRRILRRSPKREVWFSDPEVGEDHIDPSRGVDPESLFLAREFERGVRDKVVALGAPATRCWEGLLTGESLAETAQATALTTRQVKHFRKRIRQTAEAVLAEAA